MTKGENMTTDRLNILKKFFKKNRRLPSYSEMLKLFGFSSKNAVFKLINKWVEANFLKKENGKLAPTSKFFALPILGNIKAGFPILAEENKNYLTLDEYLIEDPQSSFLLKVSGDSMIGIGIFEGDIVIIEKKKEAFTGDIVLAQIDNEWTLKIFKKDRLKKIIFLEAANPRYPPFYPQNELQIYGVVRAVIRKIN
ncbi:repressor LexA [Candidatus Roizmanbacteria bacterium CG_4_10_14_0_2_um_filter_36_35]|uniref:Repressor LexA n=4 Tax=Candidatus Roizmaniibacteriota TaxID=1752723 RepID=A0A2M7BWX7_9BACT|nr:MAG: repressor LexA [Candidatus Roizmanbacteria bacterium CG11_big_fil_rev_8_21_14_0_20_35_14]PIV11067.1 MAG: repressor LexA [Candidatus Roizmanbacteria bacterium CG03_land_8_20_14_0_80_35_26]PIZ67902.1 MAG: repressor LexA [Candidatus Roizmanbacteria bacterium CG_4_10_14_0_2_um_filter_36_35]PJC32792.1 MAG: repressor LexA [Candidatus Roizmanbacteria bacterium CG_4_9_14_0_2_um_filter_36_12]PJC80990.1 MAG: repressor LexA [Candidatus Roizmanbacteria bacterium CG_4_8_14_3_um_filter_36_12]